MSSTKIDLLKRVNELQLDIQRNKELLRDAIQKDEQFAEFNKKSIKIDEARAIRDVILNKEDIMSKEKMPAEDNEIIKTRKISISSKEESLECSLNEEDDDKKLKSINCKSIEEHFLGLIDKSLFTSIDEVLSDQSSTSPNSSSLSSKRILILCKDGKIQKIKDELNPSLNFVKLNRKSFRKEFGKRIKFGITSIEICKLELNSIKMADQIIFYQFTLIDLWESIKIMNSYLQEIQKIQAIVDSRLISFLTEFKKKIQLKFV